MRQITVISSTRSQPKVINSDAETFGDLKSTLSSEFGDVSKMRAVVKETKADLVDDQAQLPYEDFTLFLAPKQIKAGGSNAVEVKRVLEDVKDGIIEAIDNAIAGIDDGEYDTREVVNRATNQGSYGKSVNISGSDRDFLNRM